MSSVWMVLAAICVLGLSGVPACLLSRRSLAGQRLATLLMIVGSVLGLAGLGVAFREATPPSLQLAWFLPWGQFAVTIDSISVIFLAPVFVVPALGSLYGLGYWKQSEHPENGRWLGLFWGLLTGAIALLFIARDGMLFLMAWEVMAMAAYFALVTEQDVAEVRQVGWIYLIATHIGTLVLFAMFAMWRHATGSFALELAQAIPPQVAGMIFVLALIGFGFKAGLIPMHFWLPGAHANAPSHLSAIMSGIMLKAGVYGLVRMSGLLPNPALWWGGSLLALGAVTGLLGIVFALSQHDFKRLLAYSSVENIGIIAMGLGLALLGRVQGQPDWILLGLAGALLHVWNHSLFKSLLFFNVGAILHATHTRQMDQLGGLGKRMPMTMGLFAVGAIAICALPPLNGFASEWLLYVGLFRTLGTGGETGFPAATLAAVALAMIGALAVACFVKLFGMVFLGEARTDAGNHAHDPSASMIAPMVVLVTCCAGIGLLPLAAAPLLEAATHTWASLPTASPLSINTLAPLRWITISGLILLAVAGAVFLGLKWLVRRRGISRAGTWDCGYSQPAARMQYTGSSFTEMLVDPLWWLFWPRRLRPVLTGLFPSASLFKTETPDLVLDRGISPAAAGVVRLLPWVRRFQQGSVHLYLFYVLLTVVFLFLL